MAENAGLIAITVVLVLVLILLLYLLVRHFGFKRIVGKLFGFKYMSDDSFDEERSILSKYEQLTNECVEDSKEQQQFIIKRRDDIKVSPPNTPSPYPTKIDTPRSSASRQPQSPEQDPVSNRLLDLQPGWMKSDNERNAGWTDFAHTLKSPIQPPQFRCFVTQETIDASDRRQQSQSPTLDDATKSGRVKVGHRNQREPSPEIKREPAYSKEPATPPTLPKSSATEGNGVADQLQSPSPSRVASPRGSGEFDPDSILVFDDDKSSRRTSISSIDSALDETSLSTLTRALSTDSVDSTYSMTDFTSDSEAGQLEVRLQYDSTNQYLFVWILQAYDVRSVAGPDAEMWVVLFLLPHPKPLWRTQLKKYSTVISFHEKFRQRVRDQDLKKLACLCQMYCRKTSSSNRATDIAGSELVGQAKVRLKDVDLAFANTLWLTLLPVSADAEMESNGGSCLGEMLFSLNYLPTAERLTVVIAKVRNLRDINGDAPKGVMVRVYLVQGAKVSRKKTSSKAVVDGSVAFNESMIFSLSQNLVTKVSLRLSVVELAKIGEQNTIGQVTVGAKRTGKEFGHWQKMVEQPRKPASMWHSLMPKKKP